MKKLYLLIMVVFLSACSTITPEPTPTSIPTITPTNTVASSTATSVPDLTATPKPTASPELDAYVNKVYLILDDLSHAGMEMDQLFTLASRRNEYLTDEGWLKLVNKTFDNLLDDADQIDAIEPVPAQAESAQKDLKLAAEEIRLVVKSQQEFLDGNFDGAYSATEHMQLHLNYIQSALDEINKYKP